MHHILLSQARAFTQISQAVHSALLNKDSNTIMWVKYNGITVADCKAICFSHNEIISLLLTEADKTPAKLFSKGAPLDNISLLEEMFEALDTHNDARTVRAFFYDRSTLTHYSTPLPLLDKEE